MSWLEPPTLLSIAVILFAIVVLFLVHGFGTAIFFGKYPDGRWWEFFWQLFRHDPKAYREAVKSSVEKYLEKRNDYWSVFGQVYISIFLIATITVLLLTKTINADAGLPLLSAIVAF